MDKVEVIERINAHRNELRAMGVKSLALFGSTARGEARTDSDVDLLVEFDRKVDLFDLCDVKRSIETQLQGKHVDLVMRKSVIHELRENIFEEAEHVF